MANATEELRRLLDERGVEWNGNSFGFCEFVTSFDIDGLECAFSEFDDRATMFRVWNGTPSQAIEATLGRRECHMRLRDDIRGHAYQDVYECSECGEQVLRETFMGESEPPNYCPHCGAKAVEQ